MKARNFLMLAYNVACLFPNRHAFKQSAQRPFLVLCTSIERKSWPPSVIEDSAVGDLFWAVDKALMLGLVNYTSSIG